MIDEKGLESINEQLNFIKSYYSSRNIKPQKNYGRSELIRVKYRNGKIVVKKFKHLEKDILAKRCSII